jgi:hypothetical protein
MPYAFTEYDVAMLSREYVKQAPPCLTYELFVGGFGLDGSFAASLARVKEDI